MKLPNSATMKFIASASLITPKIRMKNNTRTMYVLCRNICIWTVGTFEYELPQSHKKKKTNTWNYNENLHSVVAVIIIVYMLSTIL